MNVADRVPVLIVSGFLGSGKTSLVRHLLSEAQADGLRVGVISNEFGDLGIDVELLQARNADYVEISGGCVCCRLSDELVSTLQTLRDRARPDRVIVETSGLALPFETQLQLWREPVRDWIEYDVAVVVVNAEQVASGRDLDGTFHQQVSSADLLLLNQADRVEPGSLAAVETRLRRHEPEAPIVRSVHGRVEADLLFPPDADRLRSRRRDAPAPAPPHSHEAFESRVLEFEAGVAAEHVLERVRALGALRAKGFVDTREGLRLLQGVGPRLELEEVAARPAEALVGRIVTILRERT